MELCYNKHTDPAFNLALEEWALTQTERDLVILWRNRPAVIVGANQNTLEEIDPDFCRENGIAVIRRQSGGGAVFHDLGNINYTVIHRMGEDDFSNYRKFTAPICAFLGTLGVQARLRGRNDLVIGEAKFSGNAQAVRRGRIMHHGTILYGADLARLAGALRPRPAKLASKGVKSVRSRVTNVRDHLENPPEPEEFLRLLYRFFLEQEGMAEYRLTGEDEARVEELVREKYGAWEWNFGKSPAYGYQNSGTYPFGTVEVRLEVEKGMIRQAALFGDFFGIRDKGELERALAGVRHHRGAVEQAAARLPLGEYIAGMTAAEFGKLF